MKNTVKGKNKKIKNATPTTYDDITFKSKLEAYTYTQLKKNNIYAEYESTKFELIPSFMFLGKKIRPITYTPDFVGNKFIIEAKGRPNDIFPIKWKLFKYYLYLRGLNNKYVLFLVHNKKEVEQCINDILNNNLNETNTMDSKEIKVIANNVEVESSVSNEEPLNNIELIDALAENDAVDAEIMEQQGEVIQDMTELDIEKLFERDPEELNKLETLAA